MFSHDADFRKKLRAEFPAGLFELFDLQGLGPKKVKALYEALAITSVADLKAACDAGKVAGLPGFGAKTQTKILEAIALREKTSGEFLLGSVGAMVELNSETDFVARSAQAGLLWIYRERLAQAGSEPGWYLHGLFA